MSITGLLFEEENLEDAIINGISCFSYNSLNYFKKKKKTKPKTKEKEISVNVTKISYLPNTAAA